MTLVNALLTLFREINPIYEMMFGMGMIVCSLFVLGEMCKLKDLSKIFFVLPSRPNNHKLTTTSHVTDSIFTVGGGDSYW